MTEKDLLDQIKKSADQVEIPDSITPESISENLRQQALPPSFHRFPSKRAVSAAAILLLCGTLSGIAWNTRPSQYESDSSEGKLSSPIAKTEEAEIEEVDEKKADAGTLYTVAKSYDQIYDSLKSYASYWRTEKQAAAFSAGADGTGEVMEEAVAENSVADLGDSFYQDLRSDMKMASKEEHSTTNLQTEGVDESDIVKTDGRYIYTVTEQKVTITDTANDSLTNAGSIWPALSSSDSILELYVDDNTLTLLVQHYDTSLEESSAETSVEDVDVDFNTHFLPLEDDISTAFVRTAYSVVSYVYDITDPSAPTLTGTATQDGVYQTSRKIGDILYLFTRKDDLAYSVSYENAKGGIIPCVNGDEIPYDHVYLSKDGNGGLVISSFDLKNPTEAVDEVMIVHNYASIYMGNHAIYLYHQNYESDETLTQIAKFSIENGKINAVNAESVKGAIYDTFAINEYQDCLRILTTSYDRNGNSDNRLYLLDENLSPTGSLSGIAEGEEIYAARYFGDTAYFITYRNTDPLFAVDLSDKSNPVLLGELKITGFSEYLHFWENDKLLGIGYETDPDSGRTKGLKLVMFDISNPTDLKVLDSLVLQDCYYSPALYDYKCVLAAPQKNLIGFAAEYERPAEKGAEYDRPAEKGAEYDRLAEVADEVFEEYSYSTEYSIFGWEDNHFSKKLTKEVPPEVSSYELRGIYIGEQFFLVSSKEIVSFDLKNNFKELAKLSLSE